MKQRVGKELLKIGFSVDDDLSSILSNFYPMRHLIKNYKQENMSSQ
jgi:hypothetical protein